MFFQIRQRWINLSTSISETIRKVNDEKIFYNRNWQIICAVQKRVAGKRVRYQPSIEEQDPDHRLGNGGTNRNESVPTSTIRCKIVSKKLHYKARGGEL